MPVDAVIASLSKVFLNGYPKRVAVALSGGVDSMCLTHILHKALPNVEIFPLMINHNLRKESTDEISVTRAELARLGIHNCLTKELHFDELRSFEEVARVKRYQAFDSLCKPLGIKHILLGHHLDDQLETFILRLLKNSNVFGLRGMSSLSKAPTLSELHLVRPMLTVSKDQIIQYCKDNNVNWVEDHTNHQQVAQRNVVRRWLKDNGTVRTQALSNLGRVNAFTTSIEEKVTFLKFGAMVERCNESMTIAFTNKQLQENSDLVIARTLFKLVYQISPSKHFHYSFNKLLNVIPNLCSNKSFTLLHLQWEVQRHDDATMIHISRQNPTEPVINRLTVHPGATSEPFLFDNVYWMKIHNRSDVVNEYTIRLLSKDDRKNFVSLPEGFKYSRDKNRPIISLDDKVLGFASDLDFVECFLKENIYQ